MVAQQLGHRERGEAGHQRLPLPEHIPASDDCRDRRRERGRPADAKPLEFLDERSFGKSCGRRGLVPLGLGVEQNDSRLPSRSISIADPALRQDRFLLFQFRNRIVAAFHVRAAESGELDRLATRSETRDVAGWPFAEISIVVRSTRASTICDAIVRFQIRS